jgi:hypothetical protein
MSEFGFVLPNRIRLRIIFLNQMPFGSLALNLIELVLRSSGEGPTMASFGGASERASNLVLLVADQPSRNRKYPQKLHLS